MLPVNDWWTSGCVNLPLVLFHSGYGYVEINCDPGAVPRAGPEERGFTEGCEEEAQEKLRQVD